MDLTKEQLLALVTQAVNHTVDPLKKQIDQMADVTAGQDIQIKELQMRVAGLNRTISFLKNTSKFPEE